MVRLGKSFRFRLPGIKKKFGKQNPSSNLLPGNLDLSQSWQNQLLSKDLEENLRQLKTIFKNCSDVIFREFVFAQNEQIRLALVYTDGLVDKNQISEQVMRALSLEVPMVVPGQEISKARALEFIKQRCLCIHQIAETSQMEKIIDAILSGDTVLLVDGHAIAIINGSRGWEGRAVEDSKVEVLVRGPRESFVETLRTNTSLLRRKIKNPSLKIEVIKIGQVTRTDVAIAYVQGIVNPGMLNEVKQRLGKIKIDAVLEGGYLEELIEDNPLSPFCTVNQTDRVDKVAAQLLEGRVAIMVDGTPYVLTAPALFIEIIQFPEDYYQRYIFSSATRVLRLLSLIFVLLSSALYVAIISYHHELLPTALLLSIAAQREAVPFPALAEVLLMEFVFEVLREAGIRMPQPLGQAVSIVGALVIGEAAVRAGLVAATTVIVVALAGVASFSFCYTGATTIRMIRFPLILAAGMFGLPGVLGGIVLLVTHLATLRSFGVPFLSPLAPLSIKELKDTGIRAPWWAMLSRPKSISNQNLQREKSSLKPKPPETT